MVRFLLVWTRFILGPSTFEPSEGGRAFASREKFGAKGRLRSRPPVVLVLTDTPPRPLYEYHCDEQRGREDPLKIKDHKESKVSVALIVFLYFVFLFLLKKI